MYRLLTFSGFEEWQFPTGADANVAFMAMVGSTQRVISRSSSFWRLFEWVTISSVRTNFHNPFRKVGPPKPSSAKACDDSKGAEMVNEITRERLRASDLSLAGLLPTIIVHFPI